VVLPSVAVAANTQTSSFRLKWLPSAAEFSHRLLAEMWLFRRCDSPTKVSFAAENVPAPTDPKTGPLQPRGIGAGPFAKRGRESIGRTPTPLNRPIRPLFRQWFSFWFFAVMADPLEHATGIEKREMLAELAGNDVRPEFWLWHPSRALWLRRP